MTKHNTEVEYLIKYRDERQFGLDKQLRYAVIKHIIDHSDLTETQADIVESFVMQEHHAFMCDYFSYIDTYADFAFRLLPVKEASND